MPTANLPAIDTLSVEAKRQLLAKLARDLMTTSSGPLSVTDAAGGEVVVFALPANARTIATRAMRAADPEFIAELHRRAATTEDSMCQEEALKLAVPATEAAQ
jgi:hypothetical protein